MSGYFAPESAVRRIGGESILMLGGGRALLMQAAHPLVAAGIAEHSGFDTSPWRRLARTMTALYTIVFASKADADRAGAAVQAVHERVRGRLAEPAGPFPAGTRYSAADPDLQLWVHSTLVDTGLVMYETFVRRLRRDEQAAFYDDMKLVARVFGVPGRVLPSTLADFRDYQRGLLSGPDLCITETARSVAATVLRPPAPVPLQPTLRALGLTSVGLLPKDLRERYGFRWTRAHAAALRAGARAVRTTLPAAPRGMRSLKSGGRDGLPLQVLTAFAR